MIVGQGASNRSLTSLLTMCDKAVYRLAVLPPILDIYVVWHPDDTQGRTIAGWVLDHFHGTPYVGLVGGGVEVYTRSAPWTDGADAPRPMPFQTPLPYGLPSARIAAVVLVLGTRLARTVEVSSSEWADYLAHVRAAADAAEHVGIFPVRLPGNIEGDLKHLIGDIQALDRRSAMDPRVLCRDLSQQIVQMVGEPFEGRLTVFVSHTKRQSPDEEQDWVDDLIARVRSRIADTHLRPFFDVSNLQPGSDWDNELRRNAASSAMLAVRTDLYAQRDWCQREFIIAKQAGMPIVTLNAVRRTPERGSFVMDHVPVVGYCHGDDEMMNQSIDDALGLLVDQALRRALWQLQIPHLNSVGVEWAPSEAPEPVTTIAWLIEDSARTHSGLPILVMHPDPPLGPSEMELIEQLFALATGGGRIEVVTPLTFVNRGGHGI